MGGVTSTPGHLLQEAGYKCIGSCLPAGRPTTPLEVKTERQNDLPDQRQSRRSDHVTTDEDPELRETREERQQRVADNIQHEIGLKEAEIRLLRAEFSRTCHQENLWDVYTPAPEAQRRSPSPLRSPLHLSPLRRGVSPQRRHISPVGRYAPPLSWRPVFGCGPQQAPKRGRGKGKKNSVGGTNVRFTPHLPPPSLPCRHGYRPTMLAGRCPM